MPARAKRFYLCNLIPLWEVDEENMEVDWPVFHTDFGSFIEMRADISKRKIRWSTGDAATPDPDLRIRFEVYESDFLLSGGLDDRMGVFSSHDGFGDEPTVRPLKIVKDLLITDIPEGDRDKFIYIDWSDGKDGAPGTLFVRCWWRVAEPEGGDVAGDPEFYYDVFVEGKLDDNSSVSLHERSDHELVGLRWNVTDKVSRGRVTPLVDGEYVFLKMVQAMDAAEHSIHIAGWSMEPQTPLIVEEKFRADYEQVPGMDPAAFEKLLVRSKPLTIGVSPASPGVVFYTASNGNLNASMIDSPTEVVSAVKQVLQQTGLEFPGSLHVLHLNGTDVRILVVDSLSSRLFLFVVVKAAALVQVDSGVYLVPVAKKGSDLLFAQFHDISPSLPGVESNQKEVQRGLLPESELVVAGLVPLAGGGTAGWQDTLVPRVQRLSPNAVAIAPSGLLDHPWGVVAVGDDYYVTDTGNHCIRVLDRTTLGLTTLAGRPSPGDLDGAGADARFNAPMGLAWDEKQGRLLVADTGNRKLRAVTKAGQVTTVSVKSIDGAAAPLGEVVGLAFNPGTGTKGTLYVAERDRHRVLALDLETGEAVTLVGSKSGERGDADGPLAAARLDTPLGLGYGDGRLYIADSENRVVRMVELSAKTVLTLGSKTQAGGQDVPVRLADLLRRKVKDGVEVRILLDGFQGGGLENVKQLHWVDERIRVFAQNHIQAIGLFKKEGEPDQPLASFHEKMVIVDGKAGFTGGVDFGSEKNNNVLHSTFFSNGMFWHDTTVFVEGKAARGLEEHFVRRWKLLADELRLQEEQPPPPEEPGLPVATYAKIRARLRHYETERLLLDATGSEAPLGQSLTEYRWKIVLRHRWFDPQLKGKELVKVPVDEDILLVEKRATEPRTRLERKLDPGQYKLRLTVRSSGGGEDTAERLIDVLPAPPGPLEVIDRTDSSITDHEAESVRTWNPAPVFVNVFEKEVQEILESYRRVILMARDYVYLEHQYIYYPEIGDYLEQAMKDNPLLKVLWVIPFFTEETADPYQERLQFRLNKALASSVTDTRAISAAGEMGFKKQLSWHGFFRQQEMVQKLRAVDPHRFGVFSVQRPLPGRMAMIYPHSKMILCDDRFFSIGSANANGRGFTRDSEHNVSALAPAAARALRDRLWGEHLGYAGVAVFNDLGQLLPANGHHLRAGDPVRLSHPDFGTVETEVTFADAATGGILVKGGVDPKLERVVWRDLAIEKLKPEGAMLFWRSAAHSLETYRAVKGSHASTNPAGDLLITDHLAKAGDRILLGGGLIELDEEGRASRSEKIVRLLGDSFQVDSVSKGVIKLKPWSGELPDADWVKDLPTGGPPVEKRPFLIKVLSRSAGVAKIEAGLMPDLKDLSFDYMMSWLDRQEPARQLIRAWEIDPPRGIEYGGPGSFLRWVLWPFADLDPDAQARLDGLGSNVTIA